MGHADVGPGRNNLSIARPEEEAASAPAGALIRNCASGVVSALQYLQHRVGRNRQSQRIS